MTGPSETLQPSRSLRDDGDVFLPRPRQLASAGRFLILELIGEGGMGSVYRAYDPTLRREVALKFLHTGAGLRDSDLTLVVEGQARAALPHANVVAVYDVVIEQDHVVLAMEYIEGQTLRRWLVSGEPRPWRVVLDAFLEAGRGLHAAHRLGSVHHDFRPSNVLVSNDGRICVTDFGIAAGDERVRSTQTASDAVARRCSDLEIAASRQKYMAPEQHAGGSIDSRADQYAFCVALREALCGAAPFAGEALEAQKLQGPPPWPPAVRLPRRVVAAIQKGLAPDPEHRWPSMQALLEELHPPRARKLGSWKAGMVALPLLGTSMWAWQTQRHDYCSGATIYLRGIWDAAQRDVVRDAMLRTKAAYAPESWAHVQAALDRYANAWVAHHRAACEATVIERSQSASVMDLRMACLHRRKVELQSAVALLRAADDQVVENAVQMASALPSLARCDDVEALSAEVPPPEDASDAVKVEQARVLLAEGRAHEHVGKYDAALDDVDAADAAVRGVDYPPVLAEVAQRRGWLRHLQGHYREAEDFVGTALELSLAAGHFTDAAEATATLASVVGDFQMRLGEGLWLGELAVALASARGVDSEMQGHAYNNLGNALAAAGRIDAAANAYRIALTAFEKTVGPTHPLVANVRSNLGAALENLGHLEDAEVECRAALAIREQIFGGEHPSVADSRLNLGVLLHRKGRYTDAEAEFRHSLRLRENHARHEGRISDLRHNLGTNLKRQGRLSEADVELRRALGIRERLYGPDAVDVGQSLRELGTLALEQRRFADAEALLRRVLAIYDKTLGAHHVRGRAPRIDLSKALTEQGRHAEAEAELRRGIALYDNLHAPDSLDSVVVRRHLCLVLLAEGRSREAEAECAAVLAVHERAMNFEHPDVAELLLGYGRHLATLGRSIEARQYLERGVAIDQLAQRDPVVYAQLSLVLAQMLWDTKVDRARALQLGRAALRELAKSGEAGLAPIGEVRQWLALHGGAEDGAVLR